MLCQLPNIVIIINKWSILGVNKLTIIYIFLILKIIKTAVMLRPSHWPWGCATWQPEHSSWQSDSFISIPVPASAESLALQVPTGWQEGDLEASSLPFSGAQTSSLPTSWTQCWAYSRVRALLFLSAGQQGHSCPYVLLPSHSRTIPASRQAVLSPGSCWVKFPASASFGSGHLFLFLSTWSPLCDEQLSKMHLVVLTWDSAPAQWRQVMWFSLRAGLSALFC